MSPGHHQSAGIVLIRCRAADRPEFLLVHPGGPFWARKDVGAWSVPKGEFGADEDPLEAARREFREELGVDCPASDLRDLGEIVQRAGKRVRAFAGMADLDTSAVVSNTFEMEWPPRSGRMQAFPEVDRAAWFPMQVAQEKVIPAQGELLERALAIASELGWFGGV